MAIKTIEFLVLGEEDNVLVLRINAIIMLFLLSQNKDTHLVDAYDVKPCHGGFCVVSGA